MYEEFVAERLAELRQKKNVSARDMSLTLGQNENYINQIENNKALPSMQVFFYICEYLDILPSEFFDKENKDPVLVTALLDNIKKLNENSLHHIAGIVDALVKK